VHWLHVHWQCHSFAISLAAKHYGSGGPGGGNDGGSGGGGGGGYEGSSFPSIFQVTSEQEIGIDCGPGVLEPFSYLPVLWNEAFGAYKAEADMGNRHATNNLGVCYTFGRGVAKDEKLGIEYYRKAARQGSVLATNNLAMCMLRGVGCQMDEAKAIAMLMPIANAGCLMAISNMGSCYLNGEGVPKLPLQALTWYGRRAGAQHTAHRTDTHPIPADH
jgi:TPR repeat protein